MSNSLITKNALALSLKKLTARMNFDKITIADITAECGLNRQTFYYHFEDKLELLNWIYDNEAFSLTKDINVFNWNEKLKKFMQHMRRDKNFYMNTIKCSDDYFEEYVYNVLKQLIIKAIDEVKDRTNLDELEVPEGGRKYLLDEEKDLLARFFAHALCGTIVEWAMNGMKEDENELSDTLYMLLTTILHSNIL